MEEASLEESPGFSQRERHPAEASKRPSNSGASALGGRMGGAGASSSLIEQGPLFPPDVGHSRGDAGAASLLQVSGLGQTLLLQTNSNYMGAASGLPVFPICVYHTMANIANNASAPPRTYPLEAGAVLQVEEIEIEDTSEEDEDDAMPALEVDVHPPEGPVPAVADAPGVLHALQGGMLPEVLPDGGGINDDTISTSSYNSDASSMAALEDQVTDRILQAFVAEGAFDPDSEIDADDYVERCRDFQLVRRLCIAFAMGHHPRLGEQSPVLSLEEGVVQDIVFHVLSSVSREW
ncbi:hypothetical protein T484DRAFT_1862351 [Baffinella frigidus]|nr:hypothetical protein T484DRAFT_1862351 [Cryptophyta sp. CCMP2293]